jgi:hypothetical protein
MNRSKNRRRKGDFESAEYQNLLEGLKKIIGEAQAKGVSFGERDDTLACHACGAYEDVPCGGSMGVYKNRKRLRRERFIVLDLKERTYRRKGTVHFKSIYQFICTACGARQEEIVRSSIKRAPRE